MWLAPFARSASDAGLASTRAVRHASTAAQRTAAAPLGVMNRILRRRARPRLAPLVPLAYNRSAYGQNGHSSRRRARARSYRRARRTPRRARVLAEIRVLARSQGDRDPVRDYRPALPAVRVHADDDHAVAACLPGQADPAHRPVAGAGPRADGHHAPRVLQPA